MRTTSTSKFALAAILALALSAAANAKVVGDNIATVNGEPILRSEYDHNLQALTERYRATMPRFFEQKDADKQLQDMVMDQMLEAVLVEQAAEQAKVQVHDRDIDERVEKLKKQVVSADDSIKTPTEAETQAAFDKELKLEGLTYEEFRDKLRRQLEAEKYVQESLRPMVKQPSDEEVQKFFDKVQSVIKGSTATLAGMDKDDAQEVTGLAMQLKDMSAERVQVSHIFFKAPDTAPVADRSKAYETAKDVKKQLDNGADFAELARKYSQDAESASRGGDIGAIVRGMGLPLEFEKQAFALPVGQISEPFESPLGYHIVKVMDHVAAQPLRLDEIKERLATFMMNQQFRAELAKMVKKLREKASITMTDAANAKADAKARN
jgi:parvulin-like peptidyl-prolyl isomerase